MADLIREGKRRASKVLTGIECALASVLGISYQLFHLILRQPCASGRVNPHFRDEKIKRRRLNGLPSIMQQICGQGFEPPDVLILNPVFFLWHFQ